MPWLWKMFLKREKESNDIKKNPFEGLGGISKVVIT
jgi:hypothetical protein